MLTRPNFGVTSVHMYLAALGECSSGYAGFLRCNEIFVIFAGKSGVVELMMFRYDRQMECYSISGGCRKCNYWADMGPARVTREVMTLHNLKIPSSAGLVAPNDVAPVGRDGPCVLSCLAPSMSSSPVAPGVST